MIGEQLNLWSYGDTRVERAPWGGRSPRGLTRASRAFSFRREGMGRLCGSEMDECGDIDMEQLGQLLLPF